MAKTFKFQGEEYEEIPAEAVAASRALVEIKEQLGNPIDPYSKSGEKLMDLILAVWQDLWPKEAKEWIADRTEYKNAEMSITEQVHQRTGRSLASIPLPVYRLMKKLYPEYRLSDREDFLKLVKKYPIFQMANKL